MEEFIKRLQKKGYMVVGHTAILEGMKYQIKSMTVMSIAGPQKLYWLSEKV